MITGRIPGHQAAAPAPAVPRRAAPARPALRVVPEPVAPSRTPRVGLLVGAAAALVFVYMFGMVTFHVVLAQAQGELDDVTARIDDEQARARELWLETATLESPDRIARDAQERLGMVTPPDVVFLDPAADADEAATLDPAELPPPATPATGPEADAEAAPGTAAADPATAGVLACNALGCTVVPPDQVAEANVGGTPATTVPGAGASSAGAPTTTAPTTPSAPPTTTSPSTTRPTTAPPTTAPGVLQCTPVGCTVVPAGAGGTP